MVLILGQRERVTLVGIVSKIIFIADNLLRNTCNYLLTLGAHVQRRLFTLPAVSSYFNGVSSRSLL